MESVPPEDVRPGPAGTLDGVANPRDVAGTIVDLAVRGYLRIKEAAPSVCGTGGWSGSRKTSARRWPLALWRWTA